MVVTVFRVRFTQLYRWGLEKLHFKFLWRKKYHHNDLFCVGPLFFLNFWILKLLEQNWVVIWIVILGSN